MEQLTSLKARIFMSFFLHQLTHYSFSSLIALVTFYFVEKYNAITPNLSNELTQSRATKKEALHNFTVEDLRIRVLGNFKLNISYIAYLTLLVHNHCDSLEEIIH